MSEQTAIKFQPQVGVGLMVFREYNGKWQILLHRRMKVTSGSGYWGSGGGFLDYGESLLKGAVREFHEEAGDNIKIENVRLLGICNFLDFAPYHSLDVSFVADWVSGEPEAAKNGEAVEWHWFDLDGLPEPLFPVVEKYLQKYTAGSSFAFIDGGR